MIVDIENRVDALYSGSANVNIYNGSKYVRCLHRYAVYA